MSRVQLALNVANLEASIEFYSKYFQSEPAKIRPGYANFAIADPPLKLVLIENASATESLNHLGVEVVSSDEVAKATARLVDGGLTTRVEDDTTCCYARQDKVWVQSPDGAPWEVYTVLADAADASSVKGDTRCCIPNGEISDALDADATGCC